MSSTTGGLGMKTPSLTGNLLRRGFFQDWNSRYVELANNVIKISMIKVGMGYTTFKLGPNTRCEESPLRNFCFTITNPNGDTLFLAAENVAVKELWTEAIQSNLALIRLAHRKLKNDDTENREQAINQYQARPIVYIKIIRARNLTAKDSNGFSDPYVKISMGSSTVKTTTRKRNLNPDWGMVFPFDWDRSMRYAKVEVWDEDEITAHDFLGSVLLPLYTLRDGDSILQWYPLGKRSSKSNVSSGEIEIEISCSGQPDPEQNAWFLFQSIQSLPQLSINLASKVDGSGQIALKQFCGAVPEVINSPLPDTSQAYSGVTFSRTNSCSSTNFVGFPGLLETTDSAASAESPRPLANGMNDTTTNNNNDEDEVNEDASGGGVDMKGFPLHFPPIETEILEDMSLRVNILCMVNATKITNPGILFLTNYRLIFVSLTNIFKKNSSYSAANNLHMGIDGSKRMEGASLDLTTSIPIGSIMSVTLTTENESSGYGPLGNTCDAIKVKCCDGRTISFMFKDDVDALSAAKDPAKMIINKAIELFRTGEIVMDRVKSSAEVVTNMAINRGSIEQNNRSDRISVSSVGTGAGGEGAGERANSVSMSKQELNAKLRTKAQKKLSVYHYYNAYNDKNTHETDESILASDTTSMAEKCLLRLCREPAYRVEASDSSEGPPAHRMYLRLKLWICNRLVQRMQCMSVHAPLLEAISRACGQAPSGGEDVGYTSSFAPFSQPSIAAAPTTTSTTAPAPAATGAAEPPASPSKTSAAVPFSMGNASTDLADPSTQSTYHHIGADNVEYTINPAHKLPANTAHNDSVNHSANNGANGEAAAAAAASDFSLLEKLRTECTVPGLESKIREDEELVNTHIKLLVNLENSWNRYVPSVEFARLGLPNRHWRISLANREYKLCPTYPSLLVVPEAVTDEELYGAAAHRSKGRIPTLSWHSTKNNCTICRCSQPMVGLSNSRSVEDEHLLSAANRAGQDVSGPGQSVDSASNQSTKSLKPYIIADARPLLNAKANQAAGKGVESDKVYEKVSVVFMDIANIHAVRKSLEILEEACVDEAAWLRNLEASGWLGHIRKILLAVGRITHCIAYEQLSVLVHCSDGWDRTSQLTSLSMLLLDDYYRTLDGFIVLIEKEWLSFGHKFGDRLGYTLDGWKDEERSPVFAQFLDCVHQCVVQLPNAFQFNEALLLFLMEHLHSGWFGNFMFNTESELKYYSSQGNMISIWAAVLGNKDLYINKGYYPHESPVVPVVTKSRLVVWSAWFLRWHDSVWSVSWTDTNQVDLKKIQGQTGAWEENSSVTECRCGRQFSFFRRKHHCRCCGQILCEACSRELRVIPSVSTWRPCRVCNECARLIDLSDTDAFAVSSPTKRDSLYRTHKMAVAARDAALDDK